MEGSGTNPAINCAPEENNDNRKDTEEVEYMYPSGPPIPSGRSIAHHEFLGTKIALTSLDLETAGE